jgi:hypothetical protein
MLMDPSGIDTSSEWHNFISETLTDTNNLINVEAKSITGTRSHIEGRVSLGLIDIKGSIHKFSTPEELDDDLPRILGAAESADTFDLAETLPSFSVAILRGPQFHTFSTCYVNKGIFRGKSGQPLQTELQIFGTSVAEDVAANFPSVTRRVQQPYVFHEGVLTLGGTGYNFNQFVIVVDNHCKPEYNNSRTATDICPTDRTVALATSVPYTTTEDTLYTTPVSSEAGISGSLVFTKGGQSLTFTFGNLKAIARSPTVTGKTEIRLPLQYFAYKTGSTPELAVTHDSTA